MIKFEKSSISTPSTASIFTSIVISTSAVSATRITLRTPSSDFFDDFWDWLTTPHIQASTPQISEDVKVKRNLLDKIRQVENLV